MCTVTHMQTYTHTHTNDKHENFKKRESEGSGAGDVAQLVERFPGYACTVPRLDTAPCKQAIVAHTYISSIGKDGGKRKLSPRSFLAIYFEPILGYVRPCPQTNKKVYFGSYFYRCQP